ncbi:hypothetical protein RU639_004493 [Aspergillus parasiticus]
MRFTIIIFAVLPAVQALDIGKLLGGTGPLLKQLKCGAPCLLQSAQEVPCSGENIVSTMCANIDQIVTTSAPCFTENKCQIPKELIDRVTVTVKQAVCQQNGVGKGAGSP